MNKIGAREIVIAAAALHLRLRATRICYFINTYKIQYLFPLSQGYINKRLDHTNLWIMQ